MKKKTKHFCFTALFYFLICSDQTMQFVSKNSHQAHIFVLRSL